MTYLTGRKLGKALVDAKVIPEDTERVVVDVPANGVVRLYVQQFMPDEKVPELIKVLLEMIPEAALEIVTPLTEKLEVLRLQLQPGDVITVQSEGRIPREVALQIRDVVERKFPGHKALVLEAGLKLGVVGEQEARAHTDAVGGQLGISTTKQPGPEPGPANMDRPSGPVES